ncbi:MAG: YfhO family protein [Collinsella sp.]
MVSQAALGLTDTWSIILALCYTWSTWSVTNLRNPLWLDALIILPLAAWACWRLIRRGSFIPLAVLIAIDVIFCWYMAYITLVFQPVRVVRARGLPSMATRWTGAGAWRAWRSTERYFGLGLAAWTFVPTILAMLGGTGSKGISPFVTYPTSLYTRIPALAAWNLNRVPQFYTGIIPLALALAALGSRRIPRKTRALLFCFAGLLAAASVFGHLEFIWCGMRVPNGFYSRTAFLLGFLGDLGSWSLPLTPHVARSLGAIGCALRADLSPHAATRRLSQPWIHLAIGAPALVDLTLNAHACMKQLYVGYPQDAHEAYIAESSEQITRLKEIDPSPFWRLDKTYNRMGAAFNEGISLGFCQLSTYSSANSPHAVALLNSVGYSSEGEFSSVYAAPNLFMDSILGVRYASTWGTPAGYVPMGCGAPSQNGATFSRNPYALSFGLPSAASAGNSPRRSQAATPSNA